MVEQNSEMGEKNPRVRVETDLWEGKRDKKHKSYTYFFCNKIINKREPINFVEKTAFSKSLHNKGYSSAKLALNDEKIEGENFFLRIVVHHSPKQYIQNRPKSSQFYVPHIPISASKIGYLPITLPNLVPKRDREKKSN